MRRSVYASILVHLLMVAVATVVLRPRFAVPKPLDAIPIDFVALAAPAPALVERERPAPTKPPDAIPDPLKPKPKKPPEKAPEKKEPVKKPAEKPKPQPDLPKKGSADSTQVLQSELPRVGDLKGAMQMRVEGPALPYAYYLAIVQRKIASYWEPPAGIERAGGEVAAVVRFRIERDGSVRTSYVEEPSGTGVFDTSTLRALERALPLPPLPEEYPGEFLVIHLRFVYSR